MREDKAYSYFITALKNTISKGMSALEIAYNANVSEAYISQIKNNKKQAGFKGQMKIANACGFDYLEFLQYGKQLIEGEVKSRPQPIDPIVEAVLEFLEENNMDRSPEQALKAVRVLKDYEKEQNQAPQSDPMLLKHRDVIKGFQNKKKGLKVDNLLIRLEKLSKREFYKIIADIEGLVEELEEQDYLSGKRTASNL